MQAIRAARPGAEKRFAEFLLLAKIPSLRADLADYTRPTGAEPDFSGYWVDWMLLPRGAAPAARAFPPPAAYLPDAYGYGEGTDDDANVDLACAGQCGAGASPLHAPGFIAAWLPRAQAERGFLIVGGGGGGGGSVPRGARSLWEELLAYARAHPRDQRSPEALYRLIRVARWGGSHEHSGRRAFALLHARYPASSWAERSPYYYD